MTSRRILTDEELKEYHFPLTNDQLTAIQPNLHGLASKYSRCEADRHDLVQAALLALIDGKRKWKSPMQCASWAMLDYLEVHNRWNEVNGQGPDADVQPDVGSRLPEDMTYEQMVTFEGLGLTEEERSLMVMHCVQGMSWTQIHALTGVLQGRFYRLVKRVRKLVGEQWLGWDEEEA